MLRTWISLTYALNAVSRSMGALDLYPFNVAPPIERKLDLIDRLIRSSARDT